MFTKKITRIAVFAAALAAAACADSPTAPSAPSYARTESTTAIGSCPSGYTLTWIGSSFMSAGNNPGYAIDKNRNGYVCKLTNPTTSGVTTNYADDK